MLVVTGMISPSLWPTRLIWFCLTKDVHKQQNLLESMLQPCHPSIVSKAVALDTSTTIAAPCNGVIFVFMAVPYRHCWDNVWQYHLQCLRMPWPPNGTCKWPMSLSWPKCHSQPWYEWHWIKLPWPPMCTGPIVCAFTNCYHLLLGRSVGRMQSAFLADGHCHPLPSITTIAIDCCYHCWPSTVDSCHHHRHCQPTPYPSPPLLEWLSVGCFFAIVVHSTLLPLSWWLLLVLLLPLCCIMLHDKKSLFSNEHNSLCRGCTMSMCRILYPTKVNMIFIITFVVLMATPIYIKMICDILNL